MELDKFVHLVALTDTFLNIVQNMSKNVLVAEDTKNKEDEDFGIFFTTNEEEHSVLYTGNLKEEHMLLVAESKNKALIDTGCSTMVAGQDWARILVGSLSEESQAKVKKLESVKTFRFGSGEPLVLENSMQVGRKKCPVGN